MAVIKHAIDSAVPDAESGAASLLTLERCRRELRIPLGDDDAEQDALITDIAVSAASGVALDLNIPIVEQRALVPVTQRDTTAPIVIGTTRPPRQVVDPYARSFDAIRYRAGGSDGGDRTPGYWPQTIDNDGTVFTVTDLDADSMSQSVVLTPVSEWPEAAGGEYAVYYRRGITEDDTRVPALRQLVILRLRDGFHGRDMLPRRGESAYLRLSRGIPGQFPTLPDGFRRLS